MLRFRLGPVPVSVHFSFLIIALFGLGRFEALELVGWTFAVFVAVLLHEAGHAFTARAFGAREVAITLFAFGGATTYPLSTRLTAPRRFVIAAAGSAVGILVGGLVLLVARTGALSGVGDVLRVFLNTFVLASLVWGVLNWIPMLPLDGGQMLHSALEHFIPSRAARVARAVSLLFGIAAIGFSLRIGETFLALFVGLILLAGMRMPLGRTDDDQPVGEDAEPAHEPPLSDAGAGEAGEDDEPDVTDSEAADPPPSFPI